MWLVLVSVFLLFTGGTVRNAQAPEPGVIRAVPAVYPILAAVAKTSGTVIVEVTIKPDGSVAEASTIEGPEVFRVAAERSARQWVFNRVEDEHLSRTARLTYSFKLIAATSNAEDLVPIFMPPFRLEIRGVTPKYIVAKSVDPPNKSPKRRKSR
jgi:TonB family protein